MIDKPDKNDNPLHEAYRLIREKSPDNLQDWQIAESVVEVLGDTDWIPSELARECLYRIVHVIAYPDKETKKTIIWAAEYAAPDIFKELRGVNEVHMDQIEYLYRKRGL